jgi:hypothetical protein
VEEWTDLSYNRDSIAFNVVVLIAVLLVLVFARKLISIVLKPLMASFDVDMLNRCRWIIVLVSMLVLGAWLLWFAMSHPFERRVDELACMNCARNWLDGDYSKWEKGYMNQYPFQVVLVLFDALLISLFGDGAVLAFQCINIVGLLLAILLVQVCCDRLFAGKSTPLVAVCMSLFIPFNLYTNMCYGVVWGLTLSVLAIWALVNWHIGNRVRWLFVCGIAMAMAVMVKSNYSIVMVGILLYLLFDTVVERKLTGLLGIVFVVGFYLILSAGVNGYVEGRTGVPVSKGIPKLAWVAMGSVENDGTPGWWNGYSTYTYEKYNEDYDATQNDCIKVIKDRIDEFAERPSRIIRFYVRKLVSEWAGPLWECNDYQDVIVGGIYTAVFNVLQTILYAGMLLYVLAQWRNPAQCSVFGMVFAVMMIGAFIFFTVWEAKQQYAVPYHYLTIPYSVMGWRHAVGSLCGRFEANN